MSASSGTDTTELRIIPAYRRMLDNAGFHTLDDLFDDVRLKACSAERLDKPGLAPWRSRWRLTLSDKHEHQTTLYLKRFEHPPPSARREVVRSHTGARTLAGVEWAWMHRLAEDDIPCPEPVALGEQLHRGREVRSALLMREVLGVSLERWIAREPVPDHSHIAALLEPLAELIARLHGAGYVHRDLYLSHIFFASISTKPPRSRSNAADKPPASCRPAFCLIDLQRVLHPSIGLQRWIVKDLAALNYSAPYPLISTRDRLRWLKHYLGTPGLDARTRRLIYLIAGKTRRIARHDVRRQRRLLNRRGVS